MEYIPLDDLVLWTENPRDPLDGDYTNDDVIRRATDGRNDKQWQLSKLSKEMGDRFDLSELPTVCRIDDGPKYRVYDGNRRVILAMLRKAGLTTEGQQQLVPPDFPDPIPCNVCDEETALENVERKHRGNGSWKQYERDRFMFDYRGGPKTVLIRLEELIKAVRYDSESPGISSCHSDPMKSDYPRSGSWPARIRFAGMRIPCSAIADSVAPSARICERSMRRLKPPPFQRLRGTRTSISAGC